MRLACSRYAPYETGPSAVSDGCARMRSVRPCRVHVHRKQKRQKSGTHSVDTLRLHVQMVK